MDGPAGQQPDLEALGIDRSNWREEGKLRVAFRSIAALLPVDTIANAPGDVFHLDESPDPLHEFRLPGENGAVLSISDFLRRTGTDAFLVVHDGRVVFESYGEGTAARTPHITMSVTKSVTGLVGLLLHEAGAVDLHAPVSDYVPEVAASGYRGATTRQLLDMRADILWDAAELVRYRSAANWEPYTEEEAGFGLHGFIGAAKPGSAGHGAPFNYISSNTELAAWAFERATGRRFAALVSDLLWKPMGAADPACITVDRMGAARCSGGLCATVRDLARLGQVMVDDGVRAGRQVLPRAALDDIVRGGDRDAWRNGRWGGTFALETGPGMSYRSGWYVTGDAPPTVFAMGTHGQHLFLDPARRLVVVKLSSQAIPMDRSAMALTCAAVAELARVADTRR